MFDNVHCKITRSACYKDTSHIGGVVKLVTFSRIGLTIWAQVTVTLQLRYEMYKQYVTPNLILFVLHVGYDSAKFMVIRRIAKMISFS